MDSRFLSFIRPIIFAIDIPVDFAMDNAKKFAWQRISSKKEIFLSVLSTVPVITRLYMLWLSIRLEKLKALQGLVIALQNSEEKNKLLSQIQEDIAQVTTKLESYKLFLFEQFSKISKPSGFFINHFLFSNQDILESILDSIKAYLVPKSASIVVKYIVKNFNWLIDSSIREYKAEYKKLKNP